MDDLIKTFKAQLYDRISSPLISSLVIAWLSWNHRLLFALASGMDAPKKFEYIDEKLYPTWIQVAGTGIIFPLISALVFIYLLPVPARKVYEFTRTEQKKLKEIQQRIDDETPVTQEEARALKAAIRKAEADFEKELDSRNKLILKLREDIVQLETTQAREPLEPTQPEEAIPAKGEAIELTSDAIELLRKIGASPNGVDRQATLSPNPGKDTLLIQFSIDQLIQHGLITFSSGRTRFTTTAKGRAYLVQLVH